MVPPLTVVAAEDIIGNAIEEAAIREKINLRFMLFNHT
ncbi:hypothetical protein L581_3698 [Serratia fonticola AU-AP2C]|nr:hypothetical protein L581_3698 [Serratia fonticola AU-AP2C]